MVSSVWQAKKGLKIVEIVFFIKFDPPIEKYYDNFIVKIKVNTAT